MEKKSKYDTNPLDPDFVRRTDEMRGETTEVRPPGVTSGQPPQPRSREDGANDAVEGEAPTRYYPNAEDAVGASTSYPSVFIPPKYQPPVSHGPTVPLVQGRPPLAQEGQTPLVHGQRPTSRTVPGLSLPENLAMILPYLPLPLVGAVPGLVELLLVPRREVRTRFHAAQGLALHLFVLVVSTLLSTAHGIVKSLIGGAPSALLAVASTLFPWAAFVFFIISMMRVWRGETHRIEALNDATKWLNERLEPRK